VAGPPYCSDSPNFDCYSDGFPSCCLTQEDDCPENEPGCDVTGSETTAPGSSPSSSGDSSVLRGPMSLLVLLLSVMFSSYRVLDFGESSGTIPINQTKGQEFYRRQEISIKILKWKVHVENNIQQIVNSKPSKLLEHKKGVCE
jgi:hypothetical protein